MLFLASFLLTGGGGGGQNVGGQRLGDRCGRTGTIITAGEPQTWTKVAKTRTGVVASLQPSSTNKQRWTRADPRGARVSSGHRGVTAVTQVLRGNRTESTFVVLLRRLR